MVKDLVGKMLVKGLIRDMGGIRDGEGKEKVMDGEDDWNVVPIITFFLSLIYFY
jgi:hypothetical protein